MPRGRLIAAVLLAVVVLAVVRVTVAPIALPVTGMLERAARERMGADLTLGEIGVRLGPGHLEIVAQDVRLRTPDGASANVDRIEMRQGFNSRTVDVTGGALRIDPSGGTAPATVPAPGAALALLDDALAGLRGALDEQGVRRVSVHDSRLDLVTPGRPINEARVFQDVSATVSTDGPLVVEAAAIGAGGPLTLSLDYGRTEDGRTIDLVVDGLVPRDLARIKPVQDGFVLALNLSAALPRDGPPQARATVGISGGTLVIRTDPPRKFGGGRIDLALAPGGRSIEVLPSRFNAGLATVTIAGTLTAGDNPADPWTFDLTAPYAQLHSDDIDKTPVELTSATVQGRLDFARGMIIADAFHAQSPRASADAVFSLDVFEGKPWLSLAARIGQSSIDALLGAWPAVAAYKPRKAISDVVKGGVVRRGDITIAFTPLEMDPDPLTYSELEGTLSVDLEFLDTTLTIPEMPIAITRGHGALRMRDRILSVRLDGGEISAGEFGSLKVLEGAFTIPELAARPAMASITATVEGPLSAVAALAKRLGVNEIQGTELSPGDVNGTVRARLAMRTPLEDNVTMDDRQWSVDASLTDAGTAVPIGGQTFTDGDVEVLVNSRRLAARGKATIDGIRIDVNYTEVFSGGKSGAARFVLTDKDRRSRGFDTGTMLTGPVVVTVEAGEEDAKPFSIDLTNAAIDLPGFTKAKGDGLKASGKLTGGGADVAVTDLRMDGSGASLAGSLTIADGALTRAALTDVALSRGDKAKVDVRREGAGYAVEVVASLFDARALIHSALADKGDPADPKKKPSATPVAARATAERVRLSEDTYATDISLSAEHTGRLMQRLSVSGRLDGVNAGTFAARLAPAGGDMRTLQVDVTELGRMLGGLDLYERMRGGRTRLTARMTPSGGMTGQLIIDDFSLTDETTLESIIQRTRERANRGGRAGSPAALRVPEGNALTFDRLTVDFEKEGDIVTIREAVLRGPMIGGTADGVIDLKNKTMRLNGTLIPAYGVNNLFGRVPVLGQILGGGDQGGLIGVTFRFAGPLEKPQLTLNPLSAVAPGIFRKIFEYR
ncbi:AsmA-like C-terminal domain-containing protein [Acuticoccus sp. I52.16.1]|uniref:AsmA-like C-terminal domain-containing protein n=1 Tax=Acuticoccus sp. I52.16.1 TaxID=2928472 RepID=UPI001FD3047C|nr:AsmA-like C-terminal domain-containing protein [Acuticoccus sp. I52.16.1]UOM34542.1 AsmA-like C-terminal region-containing protein [Acuticoccus sp. I52.16.1]